MSPKASKNRNSMRKEENGEVVMRVRVTLLRDKPKKKRKISKSYKYLALVFYAMHTTPPMTIKRVAKCKSNLRNFVSSTLHSGHGTYIAGKVI